MEEDLQSSLTHASACQVTDGTCVDPTCHDIKRKLQHYKEVAMDHSCIDCMDVIDMCMRHVLDCPRGQDCSYVADCYKRLSSYVADCYKSPFRLLLIMDTLSASVDHGQPPLLVYLKDFLPRSPLPGGRGLGNSIPLCLW